MRMALLLALTVASSAWGQLPPESTRPEGQEPGPLTDDEFRVPLDAATASEAARLIRLLDAPKFQEREQASQKLIEIGAPAFALLRDAYRDADSLERRLRIEAVVRKAYLNHHVLDRHGFLGVQLRALDQDIRGQQHPMAQNGVRIHTVLTDTGAHRGGLKADDIIIAVDGAPLSGKGQDVVNRFRASIPDFRPGTTVRLTVLRESKTMTIDVTIGRAPETSARSTHFAAEYDRVAQRFPEWWYKYFVSSASVTAQQP